MAIIVPKHNVKLNELFNYLEYDFIWVYNANKLLTSQFCPLEYDNFGIKQA